LTSKEADLLILLHNSVNTGIEREVILNEVWGDEGDYVGRTLDVFISKLRKKLEGDSSVKIVNIRGVGYKLVLNN
jgi:DNA-binding response OmpR family regulator